MDDTLENLFGISLSETVQSLLLKAKLWILRPVQIAALSFDIDVRHFAFLGGQSWI